MQGFTGRLLPYSRGRNLTCPNNPEALSIIQKRVEKACKEDFDGVFIDNIFFGLPPLFIFSDFLSFCGCSCVFCQRKFQKEFGYNLPISFKKGEKQVIDFLQFRANSMYEALLKLQQIVKSAKKEFGVNLYDPISYTPEVYFGYSLEKIENLLSYFLIENLSLPSQISHNNSYFKDFIKDTKKPVFIVSYNKGIGWDSEYSQRDLDYIFSEAQSLNYSPCLKTSEYKTKNIWHYMYVKKYKKPVIQKLHLKKVTIPIREVGKSNTFQRLFGKSTNPFYPKISRVLWDSRAVYAVLSKTRILPKMLKKRRRVDFGRGERNNNHSLRSER